MRALHRVALMAAVLLAAIPLVPSPASAAGKQQVARCRNPRTCWPAAFAFTPDGSELFYVERFSGEIRHVPLAGGADQRWGKIKGVAGGGERGALGLALDPDWSMGPDHQWVYVYYTDGHPEVNRIIRLRKQGGGTQQDQLVRIPANSFHDGGVIHFGPDGKLYAVTGDAGNPDRSQQRKNLGGKVLRLEETGARPADNPMPGSKAFSFGHRNSFGFTFDPRTGKLWQTENGPTCDDEINLVLPGDNYGWGGASTCPDTGDSGPNPQAPELRWNPLIAPTGAAFCDGCGLAADVDGDLLVGAYLDGRIRNLDLNADRTGITGQGVVLDNPRAVLAVEAAPDGRVYFSDNRGIYRLV